GARPGTSSRPAGRRRRTSRRGPAGRARKRTPGNGRGRSAPARPSWSSRSCSGRSRGRLPDLDRAGEVEYGLGVEVRGQPGPDLGRELGAVDDPTVLDPEQAIVAADDRRGGVPARQVADLLDAPAALLGVEGEVGPAGHELGLVLDG